MKPLTTTVPHKPFKHEEFNNMHQKGAARFGWDWHYVNRAVTRRLMVLGVPVENFFVRHLVTTVVAVVMWSLSHDHPEFWPEAETAETEVAA